MTTSAGTQIDMFMDILGFLTATQSRKRGPVTTNSMGEKTWFHHYKPYSK
jgi:hypothetical protein